MIVLLNGRRKWPIIIDVRHAASKDVSIHEWLATICQGDAAVIDGVIFGMIDDSGKETISFEVGFELEDDAVLFRLTWL